MQNTVPDNLEGFRRLQALTDSTNRALQPKSANIPTGTPTGDKGKGKKGTKRSLDSVTHAKDQNGTKGTAKKAKTTSSGEKDKNPIPDLSSVKLPDEAVGDVPVYDTCNEIRRKISNYLRRKDVTQASLLRGFANALITSEEHGAAPKKFQSKELNRFRGLNGPNSGSGSQIFYAAYVFFEKLRVKEDKPKSEHRLEMEKRWAREGGFDRTPGPLRLWSGPGMQPYVDEYGCAHVSRF